MKPPPEKPVRVLLPDDITSAFQKQFGKAKSFNVFIRARGQFRKVNRFPLTRGSALSTGHAVIENSTARSFFIRKGKGKPRRISTPGIPAKQYRIPVSRSRLPQISLVEKNAFTINTRGEKQGLSAAKYLARRTPQRRIRSGWERRVRL